MAVKIRLKRVGKKKKPFYRVVVQDERRAPNGPVIEEVGYFNPMTEPPVTEIKGDRVQAWLGQGAIPSPTVKTLLKKNNLLKPASKEA